MIDYSLFRPVKVCGIGFIVFTILSLVFFYNTLTNPETSQGTKYFIIIICIWHLFTGLGILMQKMWGYYLMKFYLYVMCIGVPICTYFALKGLRYLRENEIKKFFDKSISI
jgi:hypothetical protein